MRSVWNELKRLHCIRCCFKSCLEVKSELDISKMDPPENSSTAGLMEPRNDSSALLKTISKSRFQSSVDPEVLKTAYKEIINTAKKWVLFQNGTIVICDDKAVDMEAEAKEFLAENGKIMAGTPLGDFDPVYLPDPKGWLISFHTDRIFTFVPSEETGDMDELSLAYGLIGRGLRQKDSNELIVIDIKTD